MSAFAEANCRDEHERATPALTPDASFDCHLGDLHVLEVAFRGRHSIPSHCHESPRLVFVFNGEVSETYGNGSILCDANSFSFHPPVLIHRNDTGSIDARAVMIEPGSQRSRSLLSLIGADVAAFTTRAPRLRDTALELSFALRSSGASRPLLVEAIALDLVARAARLIAERSDPEREPPFLDEARALIESSLHRSLSLAELSAATHISPRRLSDAFRIHEGTTFRTYLRHRRIARARSLLRAGDTPIAEVALATGFCDQSHLTRTFREVTGLTPMSWRDQSRTESAETF